MTQVTGEFESLTVSWEVGGRGGDQSVDGRRWFRKSQNFSSDGDNSRTNK